MDETNDHVQVDWTKKTEVRFVDTGMAFDIPCRGAKGP